MKKHELLNFAKGINPVPIHIQVVYYHLEEGNKIVIDQANGFVRNSNSLFESLPKIKECEIELKFIAEVESIYIPTSEQLKKAFFDWFAQGL